MLKGAQLATVFILAASLLVAGIIESAFAAGQDSLKVGAKIAKKTVNPGGAQKISIKVTDDAGKSVKGAALTVIVSNPKGDDVRRFTGVTGSSGTWSFIYKIEKDEKPGLNSVEIKAAKAGYDSDYDSIFYKIKKKQ